MRSSSSEGDSLVHLYISYHDKDKEFLNVLEENLKPRVRRKELTFWSRNNLIPGERHQDRKREELAKADAVIVFISASYLALDDELEKEYQAILDRSEAGVMVIPVVARATYGWKDDALGAFTPAFEGKPIGSQPNGDEAWANVLEWIKRALAEFKSRQGKVRMDGQQSPKDLIIEISARLSSLEDKVDGVADKQTQLLAEEKRTQAMLAAQTDLLLHKLACIRAYQGTVYRYIRGMEERLSQTNAQNHKELGILLGCIEDGITLALEELDASKREELAAMSPKPGGAGLLDLLKVKLPLIPLALGLLMGDEEKVAELLTEGLIVDSSVKGGGKLLVEAWRRARGVLG